MSEENHRSSLSLSIVVLFKSGTCCAWCYILEKYFSNN